MIDTGGSSGGLRGLGVAGVASPPPKLKKIVVIRVAVVIHLVFTSLNNACLCALNGVAA